MPGRREVSVVLLLLAVWLLTGLVSYHYALHTAGTSLAAQLAVRFPAGLVHTTPYLTERSELSGFMHERLLRDLSVLPVVGGLPLLHQCRANRVHPESVQAVTGGLEWGPVIALPWRADAGANPLQLRLSCEPAWQWVLPFSGGLALLLGLAGIALPRPPSNARRTWLRTLLAEGMAPREALRLTRVLDTLDAEQQQTCVLLLQGSRQPAREVAKLLADPRLHSLDEQGRRWLAVGQAHGEDDPAVALAIACAAPVLEFRSSECAVICHGCRIALPCTPFLYYRWYAQRRHEAEDDGWYTNPPSNGADQLAATSLLALMHDFGAHPKAQRELSDRGLRAKVLDQNRSKVKDELLRALGPELAEPFLFAIARDDRTARYRYRLRLEPAQIVLDEAPKRHL